ncbi:MAG: endonuclease domain-containing protein [Alphaproteobacteria bacterium]|nr:endonuclease domain-containing protein [Alphaproteobacteria bacterium]
MRSMVEGALRAPSRTFSRARELRRRMTLPEVVLWEVLRKGRLAGLRFRRQHPIGPYILDFFCLSARMAVEVDGFAHDTAAQGRHDQRREAWLAARGIRVFRILASDVLRDERLEGVLLEIERAAALAPSGARRASPPPQSGGGTIPSGRPGAAGFTIIEILVVLIIVALISGILLFAFERVLDIRVRLAAFLEGSDVPTLVAGWFRNSVEGLLPDIEGGGDRFTDSPRSFSGLSVAPIDGMAGVPTRITWRLDFEAGAGRTYLRYRDADGDPLTVASWPGDLGSLSYCGADLSCGDRWPPPMERASELPALIRLNAVKGTDFWPILAAPQADRAPLPKIPRFDTPGR